MLPALFGLIPAMIGYGVVPSVALAALVGMLHGSSESFASISAQVLVLEVSGAQRAAVGAAVLDAAGLVAATAGALLAPTVYGSSGRALFIGAGAIGLTLGLLARLRAAQGSDAPLDNPRPLTRTA
jgi:MFS family permease